VGAWPVADGPMMTLARLQQLPPARRDAAVRGLAPENVSAQLAALRRLGRLGDDVDDLFTVFRPEQGELKLRMPARRVGGDYAFLLDLDEHGLGEIELAFIQINDLTGPRYDIDVDAAGRLTMLGTARRNIPEELRAMEAGLGPGQVRHGLGAFSDFFGALVEFAAGLGFVNILLEPLTYHNALMYERYGFIYVQGRHVMEQVDAGFTPGGEFSRRLDGSTPFRRPGTEYDQRMRSWAIHDGILGRPLPDLHMVHVVGQSGPRVCTFSGPADPRRRPLPASPGQAGRKGGGP